MILFRGHSLTSASQPELASGSQLKTGVSHLRIAFNYYYAIHSQNFYAVFFRLSTPSP